jgi:hypothetical protein
MSGKHARDPAFAICAVFAVVLCTVIAIFRLMLGR